MMARFNIRHFWLGMLLLAFGLAFFIQHFVTEANTTYTYVALGFMASIIALLIYFFDKEINRAAQLHYNLTLREEYLQQTLSGLEEGVITTDMEGVIKSINRAAEQITGWKSDECIGKPLEFIYNIINEETGKPFPNIVSRILKAGEPIEFENNTILFKKNREQIIISNNGSPIRDVAGTIVGAVLVFRDITSKKRAQEEITTARQTLQTIFNQSLDVICTTNSAGEFVSVSAASEKMWGYRPEELQGKPFIDFVYEPDREKTNLVAIKVINGEQQTNFDNRYKHKNGKLIPVTWAAHWDNELNLMFCVARDATERIEAEEKMIFGERRFRALIENSADMKTLAAPDGTIKYGSPSIFRVLGYSIEELINTPAIELLHKDEIPALAQKIKEILKTPGKSFYTQQRIKHKGGYWIWAEGTITNMLHLPEIQALVSNFRDITRQKEAQDKILKSEERYRQIVETSQEGIWLIDEHNKTIFVNKRFTEIFGYSFEEMLGKSNFDLMDEAGKAMALEKIARRKQGISESFDQIYIAKNGEKIWTNVSASPIIDDDGLYVGGLAMLTDITSRKKAEEKLQESFVELQAAFEMQASILDALPANISLLNNDGAIVAVNQSWIRFGLENNSHNNDFNIGDNYIEISDGATGEHEQFGKQIAEGIRAVINGKSDFFELEYPCHSPIEQKWYKAEVAPLTKKHGAGAIVMHFNITSRKLAEEKDKANELKYSSLIEQATDAIVILSNRLELEDANPAAEHLFGYTKQELVQLKVTDLMLPEEAAINNDNVEKLKAGKNVQYERKALRKDGTHLDIELSAKMNADGRIVIFARDITERKKQIIALKESNELIQKLTDQVPVAVYQFEMNAAGNMSFPFMGKGIERIMPGNTARQVMADAGIPFSRIHPDELQSFLASIEHSRQTLSDWEKEYRVIMDNGEIKWMKASSRPEKKENGTVVWYGYIEDITERKKAEEKIHFDANLLNIVGESIIATDINGVIIYWNKSAQKTYGWSEKEVLGRNVIDVTPAQISIEVGKEIMNQLTLGKTWSGEYFVQRKDRSEFWAFVSDFPIHNEKGELIAIVGVSRDITEEKRVEDEIRALNESLEERVKQRTAELTEANNALEAFSYSVSHDLRSPVRSLIGFTKIIQKEYEPQLPEDVKELFGHIYSSSRRMDNIITDLLTLAKYSKNPLQITTLKMEELVNAVWDKVGFATPHRAMLHMASLPKVQGDASMLEQVMVNLLSNAVKYTSRKENPEVIVGFEQSENTFTFFVKDNGAGFEMKYYDRMFGVFQRLHGSSDFEGTGIGLNIVKRIIEKHGGRVWAEGKVDEGATFYFNLPVIQ